MNNLKRLTFQIKEKSSCTFQRDLGQSESLNYSDTCYERRSFPEKECVRTRMTGMHFPTPSSCRVAIRRLPPIEADKGDFTSQRIVLRISGLSGT
ncbi:hypothetical protein AVEN_187851-1 [Araneus ventricosus]|uniref:Uncharacterized protein n=1 Tax=Araneus ventricosus TaxID=182803 RepID=A0A4Y2CSF2_ARAVE|nr:hypothetical protein AVEN_187851-1 [Araneus ventricosus]